MTLLMEREGVDVAQQGAGEKNRRAVVVHAGARDAYQVALGLQEQGLLETLVTDIYCPQEENWARLALRLLPNRLRSLLLQRSRTGLKWANITLCAGAGLKTLICEKVPSFSIATRREVMRKADTTLGERAGRIAKKRNSKLVSYSYTGFQAFNAYGKPGILFQAHPHPATMRRILQGELEKHPDCAPSLLQEWELALPEEDYRYLVKETEMASRYIVASSFTKASLVENGVNPSMIDVVPYGIDLSSFQPGARRKGNGRLELLFVGRINQRKGVKYLVEALRSFEAAEVHLTVCGRVVDDLAIFRGLEDRVTIRPSVSASELRQAYRDADLFVFPSVAEGFAQVLLESLASGLPILSTTHTAAPDLIENGVEGFVVEPFSSQAIADRILWALQNRAALVEMGIAARSRAEQCTWEQFRLKTAKIIASA